MKRWRRVMLYVAAGAVTLYALAGFVVAPRATRSAVLRYVPEATHRPVALAKVRFNPFTLKLMLVGFELGDRDSTPLVGFDTLVVNLSMGSVLRRALVLDEFRLVGPRIVVRIMADGKLAIADLLPTDTASAPDTSAPSAPPRLVVHSAKISAGKIGYRDLSQTPNADLQFSALDIGVKGLSTLPDARGGHDLIVTMGGGGRLTWNGRNQFEPLLLEGEVGIEGLKPARLTQAFGASWPLIVTDGNAEMHLRYKIDRTAGGELNVAIADGSLEVRRLAVRERAAARAELVRIPAIVVRGIEVGLLHRTAHVGLVRVSDLWVRAARGEDGILNWQRVIAGFGAKADTVPPDTAAAGPAWTATLDTVELTNGTAIFADQQAGPDAQVTASGILVRVTNASTDSTRRIGLEFATSLGSGRVRVAGGVTRSPRAVDMDIEAQQLPLAMAQPWVGHAMPVRLVSGTASARGRLRVGAGRPATIFEGTAGVDQLAISDSAGDSLFSWRALAIRGIHYTQSPNLLRIAGVSLERPSARVVISRDSQLNLSALSPRPGADSASRDSATQRSAARDTAPGLPWQILAFSIKDARIDFSDHSLIMPFRAAIDSTQLTLRDIASSGGSPSALDVRASISPAGSARVRGHLNLADPLAATDIRAEVRHFVMSGLTPYSAGTIGYAISSGQLDLDLYYRLVDRRIHAEHHIVASDLTLGEPVAGGANPGFEVKTALTLMRDSHGRITLDLPIDGSIDDPQFSYGSIMSQGIQRSLRTVATAPFRFIGNRLGVGGDNPDLVDFEPGRSNLAAPERTQLDALAAELARRPELSIEVEGRYDSVADLAAIRTAALDAKARARRDSVAARTRGAAAATPMSGILESLYVEQYTQPSLDALRADKTTAAGQFDAASYNAEVRTRLVAAQPVAPGALERLGQARATAIAAVLRGRTGMDPARVTVSGTGQASRKRNNSLSIASEMKLHVR